jgi:glycosyltransferase involved in cell wall biosynthesis
MAESIGISAVFRQDQFVGGAFSVFENLARGFVELLQSPTGEKRFELTVFHGNAKPPRQNESLHWKQVSDRFGRFAAETNVAWRQGRNLDALLFLNYFTPPVVSARRAVTVVHDLQYMHMPELYRPSKRLWLRMCHAVTLRKCHRVVVISNAVKEDMLRLYGDRWADRIEVIWNPISLDRFEGDESDRNFTGGRPYILCVSVDRPQKNLFRLIHAFNQVRAKHPDYVLVIAGQLRSLRRSPREQSACVSRQMPSTVDLVEDLGLQDHVRVTGFIADHDLGALYRGATMCILPSLFEGFGMPAVESLAMGKPTLVSGLPVLREVTFNSANYLDNPEDVDAMARAIASILADPDRSAPAPALMQQVRASFAPQNIARQYLRALIE